MSDDASAFRLHFISGLPRAGSTLLAALLRQNPRFRTGISSPLAELFLNTLDAMGHAKENGPFITEIQRERLLRGLFTSFYGPQPPGTVVFDTSRLWAARLSAVRRLFPDARVICCVRDVGWVMDSFERLIRRNPFYNSILFETEAERNTVYSRVDTLGQRNRVVGFALCAVKEAFHAEEGDRVLVVDYDLLAAQPEGVLRLIYDYLGEPWFAHDVTDVSFDDPAFDARIGLEGMHRVSGAVAPRLRPTILPPDLFQHYSALSFWRDGPPGRASLIAAKPAPGGERI